MVSLRKSILIYFAYNVNHITFNSWSQPVLSNQG